MELSDPAEIAKLRPGILLSMRAVELITTAGDVARLRQSARAAFAVSVGSVPAANVYVLDSKSLAALRGE